MVHSKKKFIKPADRKEEKTSNSYPVSYVNFEGKAVTRFYDRHLDNKKK